MNIWFRRSLVVLTVGGGFFGAVISTDTLFAAKNTPVFGYAMIALVIALYIYGIFAGIRLSEDARRWFQLRMDVPIGQRLPVGYQPTKLLGGRDESFRCRYPLCSRSSFLL